MRRPLIAMAALCTATAAAAQVIVTIDYRPPETVQRGLAAFLRRTQVDELMVTAAIHDHAARLRSFELVAQVRDRLGK